MKNFALIGAAGYIAPRHMKAVKESGNALVAAFDTNDSVGVIDQFFPKASFFTEFERFDRHINKLYRSEVERVDYIAIATPNYLHDAHMRFSLNSGANAICEKPLVINPWNLDALIEVEQKCAKRVFGILQLRLHPSIKKLKAELEKERNKNTHDIDLTYVTSRGNWYLNSWKGDVQKSGGIATNIGIHFFDVLSYLFGEVRINKVHLLTDTRASGYLELTSAKVRWFLSIDETDLPQECQDKGEKTYRSLKIGGQNIEFSSGFNDLHTESYINILNGDGFGLETTRSSVEIVSQIRNAKIEPLLGDYHPLATTK